MSANSLDIFDGFRDSTTSCSDCGCYYSVMVDSNGYIYQWVRTLRSGFWFLMEGEVEGNLAIQNYETKYTCYRCK